MEIFQKLANFKLLVILAFLAYLVIGLVIVDDYGISWDEPAQRQLGYVNFIYITKHDPALLGYSDKFYGPAFEIPLVVLERAFHLTDPRTIYLSRHILTFLTFFGSVIFFYWLNLKLFSSWKWAGMSCLLLVLSPRIFADSFYNTKDIPLLAFYIIASCTLYKILTSRSLRWLLIHAVVCAVLVDIRITGILMPVLSLILLVINEAPRRFAALGIFSLVWISSTILFWPLLWSNPMNLIEAVRFMANYPYQANLPTLYWGQYISTFSIPWHYVPVWIFISTPLAYSLLFLVGVARVISDLSKFKKISDLDSNRLFDLSLLGLFFGPIAMVIIFHSTLYDGWRHLYFIYPFMVILMVRGLKLLPRFVIWLLVGEVLTVVVFMLFYHPFQNLYFNNLFNQNMSMMKANFEMDYWGLSYRKGLEYIVSTDKSSKILVVDANNPGNTNSLMLPPLDRDRLQFSTSDNINQADYFIGNYRWHSGEYGYANEVYGVKIGEAKIMVVYKLK